MFHCTESFCMTSVVFHMAGRADTWTHAATPQAQESNT